MKRHYLFKVMLLAITLTTQYSFSQLAQNAPNEEKQVVSQEQQKQLLQNNQTQIGFEENKGQVTGDDAERVKYSYNSGGVSLYLLNDGLSYVFTKTHYPEGYEKSDLNDDFDVGEQSTDLKEDVRTETYRMDVQLLDANLNSKVTTEGKSEDYIQYYNHNVLDVHHYSKVTYHDIYPNIDWVIIKNEDGIKYDFVVHPGGNPNQIKMQTKWVENAKLNEDGSLTLSNQMGEITEKTPISFQDGQEIETAFELEGDIIQFKLENYDKTKTLIIDPTLMWGTYYARNAWGGANATDGAGNVYLTGTTSYNSDIPSGGHQMTGGGLEDAFLVKFNSNGVRLWATFYGGTYRDDGIGCTTDNLGNVYMCGWTRSQNNIGYNGHLNNANTSSTTNYGFLVKFNSSGVRQWATYYGDGGDNTRAVSCATDGVNNVYLSGFTSADLDIATTGSHQPVYGGGARDAFLVKFNSTGTRLWATYYGGSDIDMGTVCAVDNTSENVYLSGATGSNSNIAFNGHQNSFGGTDDAFVVKFDSSGTRQWATYYGGSSYEGTVGGYDDLNASIALDDIGNIFLAGRTRSTNNIASSGHQNTLLGDTDAFLVKFNSSGIRQWGTYYGGSDRETGYSCATDNNGNVFMVGHSNSTDDLLATPGVHQETKDGISNAYNTFVVKFNTNGIRQWGTYYGIKVGASIIYNDNNGYVGACSVDNSNNVYVGGFSESGYHGYQGHDNYPSGNYATFLGKFFGTPCVALSQPGTISGSTSLCENATETFSVTNDPDATSYTWTFPSGWSGISTTNSITATAGSTGGTIEVIAENSCGVSSSQTLSVTVNTLPTVVASGTATICEGDATTLTASGASTYAWNNGAGSGTSVSVSPTTNTTYTVTGTDGNGCENTDDVTITVNSLPTVTATGTASICEGESTPLTASGASTYTWDNGAGTGASVSVAPTSNTTYTVTGTDANGCENTDDVTVTVNSLPTVTATGTASICEGESTPLTASGASTYSWDNGAGTGASVSVSPTTNTTYTLTGTDANGCENTDDVTVTVNPLPTVNASADETICEGESTTISASGAIAFTWDNGLGSGSTQTVSPTSNTTYIVTGTDANGCENTDQVTISTQIVPDNGVTLEADNVTITANSSGIDYTWIDCDNNFQAIPGETSQSFTATENGNYAVIVTNQGCADTSDCVVIDKVSLTSNSLNPNISLVPNPTNNVTKIVTDVQINKVQVVDFSGKIINVPHNKSENELNFSNLPVGTYFIQIQTLNGNYVERVVVM